MLLWERSLPTLRPDANKKTTATADKGENQHELPKEFSNEVPPPPGE